MLATGYAAAGAAVPFAFPLPSPHASLLSLLFCCCCHSGLLLLLVCGCSCCCSAVARVLAGVVAVVVAVVVVLIFANVTVVVTGFNSLLLVEVAAEWPLLAALAVMASLSQTFALLLLMLPLWMVRLSTLIASFAIFVEPFCAGVVGSCWSGFC